MHNLHPLDAQASLGTDSDFQHPIMTAGEVLYRRISQQLMSDMSHGIAEHDTERKSWNERNCSTPKYWTHLVLC